MVAVLVLPGMITDTSPTLVAILGAGPAGMSCANACLSFGLRPVVIERGDHAGGAQRTNFHPNLWMLGAPGESGETMTRRMAEHFGELGVESRFRTQVVRVEQADAGFAMTLKDREGRETLLHAAAIVLATGMRPHATPALEALARQSPRVIVGPLSDTIRDDIHQQRVLILGGGDNALDHALFLAERGNRVVVCTRGRFSARAGFLSSCGGRSDVSLRADCPGPDIALTGSGLRAAWPAGSEDFDWLLVMYGYRPNTDVLAGFAPGLEPDLIDSGHVRVDTWQRTSTPGVYAAGDLTAPPQPSVPTAIAQGLAAARAIERDRRRD